MANINSYTDEFKKQIVALYQSGKSVLPFHKIIFCKYLQKIKKVPIWKLEPVWNLL